MVAHFAPVRLPRCWSRCPRQGYRTQQRSCLGVKIERPERVIHGSISRAGRSASRVLLKGSAEWTRRSSSSRSPSTTSTGRSPLPRRPWLADRGIVGQEFHDEVTGADGTIAIFTLDGGLLLTLYERTNLAKDASLPPGRPVPPSSAWASPPSPARRSTGCSPRPRPPAAR